MAEYDFPLDGTYRSLPVPGALAQEIVYLTITPVCPPQCIKNGQATGGNHGYQFIGFSMVQLNGTIVCNSAAINVDDLALGTLAQLNAVKLRASTLITKVNGPGGGDCDPPIATVTLKLVCNGQVILEEPLADTGERTCNMIYRLKLQQS